jgi:hypothetical protein
VRKIEPRGQKKQIGSADVKVAGLLHRMTFYTRTGHYSKPGRATYFD